MSYVVEPGTDPQEARRRRRLAEALMQQGMDTSPIQSPWQGAARMAQALMGGWELGLEDKRDREDRDYQKGISGELNTFGGGAAPSATTAAIAGKPTFGPIKLGGFDSSLGRTLQFEGGVNPSDTNGTPSVNGINQKANPDVDLNRVQSDPAYRASIYRERYWNPIQADKMDPRLAHVAFDTSVIAGPGKAKELLEKSGGDPETFLKLREDFQNRLLKANPDKFGKYAQAWANRNATLRADIGVNPGGMFAVGGGGQATMAGGSGDTLQPSAPAAAAGGMTPQMRRLMQIATDPRAGKANQDAAKMQLQLLQQQQEQARKDADPLRQLQIQKARRDLETPNAVLEMIKDADGNVIGSFNKRTGERKLFPAQGPAQDIPPEAVPPPGVDPKTWRKEFTEKTFKASQPPSFEERTALRKEVQNLPSYKNFAQAAPIYRSMVKAAGTDSKASDLNLVYGLGKIMDPTSVVREGEMVMVKSTAGLPEWFVGLVNGLNGGAALSPETRKAIMAEAYSRMQAYQDQFGQDAEFYKGVATRGRMPIEDIIPNFGTFEPWAPKAAAAPPPTIAPNVDPRAIEEAKRRGLIK